MMAHMFGNSGYWGNSADLPENMKQMMQNQYNGMYGYGDFYGVLHLIGSLLVIALLVALVRYFWLLGDKKGGR